MKGRGGDMSYWDYIKGKKKRLRKCWVCGKRALLELTKSSKGNHPNDDRVWFQVNCTFCNTRTPEVEGCWADEIIVKDWNNGDVHEDKAVKKLLKKIPPKP